MKTFANLPLFATDAELAEAVVGKSRAGKYLETIKQLEHTAGFPPVDIAHGGRYVPAVEAYYQTHHGLRTAGPRAPDQPERPEAWNRKRVGSR